MGDPAGVGPELCLRLLSHQDTLDTCLPVVFGDSSVLRRVADAIGLSYSISTVSFEEWETFDRDISEPVVIDLHTSELNCVQSGLVDASTGAASYRFIAAAIDAALSHKIAAVVTGPINKEAIRSAGIQHPGHTEIFAEKTGSERSCMMLTSDELTCSFVTTHIGYRDVPAALSVERVSEVIDLSAEAMRRLRGRSPKLVVCGLNPHAGEHGLFGGGEEESIILPAIKAARQRGLEVEGPLPPDTAFLPLRRSVTDVFICMYHDQGHIPLKALAFDKAINVTLGLPIVRTSVDHGTALDIAWKGLANPSSLIEATHLAVRLSQDPSRSGGL